MEPSSNSTFPIRNDLPNWHPGAGGLVKPPPEWSVIEESEAWKAAESKEARYEITQWYGKWMARYVMENTPKEVLESPTTQRAWEAWAKNFDRTIAEKQRPQIWEGIKPYDVGQATPFEMATRELWGEAPASAAQGPGGRTVQASVLDTKAAVEMTAAVENITGWRKELGELRALTPEQLEERWLPVEMADGAEYPVDRITNAERLAELEKGFPEAEKEAREAIGKAIRGKLDAIRLRPEEGLRGWTKFQNSESIWEFMGDADGGDWLGFLLGGTLDSAASIGLSAGAGMAGGIAAGVPGAMAATGLTSGAIEYSSRLTEYMLREAMLRHGADLLQRPADIGPALESIVTDEALMAKLQAEAGAEAKAIGLTEAATAGISHGIAAKILGKGVNTSRIVAAAFAGTPIEMLGGSLGEMNAYLASGKPLTDEAWKNIFVEGAIEGPGAVGNVVGAAGNVMARNQLLGEIESGLTEQGLTPERAKAAALEVAEADSGAKAALAGVKAFKAQAEEEGFAEDGEPIVKKDAEGNVTHVILEDEVTGQALAVEAEDEAEAQQILGRNKHRRETRSGMAYMDAVDKARGDTKTLNELLDSPPVSLQDDMDDAVARGEMTREQADEFAWQAMEAAGETHDASGKELTPADVASFGYNARELRDNVTRDVVAVNQGATLETVAEERSEMWLKNAIAHGQVDAAEIDGYIAEVMLAEGEDPAAYNSLDDTIVRPGGYTDKGRNRIEKFSKWAVARLQGNLSKLPKQVRAEYLGRVNAEGRARAEESMRSEGLTPTLRQFLRRLSEYLKQVMKRAVSLARSLRDGKVSERFGALLDESVGIDAATLAKLQAGEGGIAWEDLGAVESPGIRAATRTEQTRLQGRAETERQEAALRMLAEDTMEQDETAEAEAWLKKTFSIKPWKPAAAETPETEPTFAEALRATRDEGEIAGILQEANKLVKAELIQLAREMGIKRALRTKQEAIEALMEVSRDPRRAMVNEADAVALLQEATPETIDPLLTAIDRKGQYTVGQIRDIARQMGVPGRIGTMTRKAIRAALRNQVVGPVEQRRSKRQAILEAQVAQLEEQVVQFEHFTDPNIYYGELANTDELTEALAGQSQAAQADLGEVLADMETLETLQTDHEQLVTDVEERLGIRIERPQTIEEALAGREGVEDLVERDQEMAERWHALAARVQQRYVEPIRANIALVKRELARWRGDEPGKTYSLKSGGGDIPNSFINNVKLASEMMEIQRSGGQVPADYIGVDPSSVPIVYSYFLMFLNGETARAIEIEDGIISVTAHSDAIGRPMRIIRVEVLDRHGAAVPYATAQQMLRKAHMDNLFGDTPILTGAGRTYSLKATAGGGTSLPMNFYSQAARIIEEKMPNSATPAQVMGILDPAKNPVKKAEVEWLGIEAWLAGKEKVSKAEVLEFIEQNKLPMKEVVYQTPEITPVTRQEEKIVKQAKRFIEKEYAKGPGIIGTTAEQLYGYADPRDYIKAARNEYGFKTSWEDPRIEPKRHSKYGQYRIGHPNPLGWGSNYREFVISLDAQPEFRERELGWTHEDGYEFGGFQAPEHWVYQIDARSKFLIYATGDGYKVREQAGMLFVPSASPSFPSLEEAQAYVAGVIRNASKDYRHDHWHNLKNPMVHMRTTDRMGHDGKRYLFIDEIQSDWTVEERSGATQLHNPVGDSYHELALKRLLQRAVAEGYDGIAFGNSKQVQEATPSAEEGELHKLLYDQLIPGFLRKFTKKWGGKLEPVTIGIPTTGNYEVTGLTITDEMRADIPARGMATFSLGGPKAVGFAKAQAEGRVFEGLDGKPRFELDASQARIIQTQPGRRVSGKQFQEARKFWLKMRNPKLSESARQDAKLDYRKAIEGYFWHLGYWDYNEYWQQDSITQAMEANDPDLMPTAAREQLQYVMAEGPYTLGEILHFPELFENYPQLAEIGVVVGVGGGTYVGTDVETGQVVQLGLDARLPLLEAIPALMHEVQHLIQVEEGFTRGGAPDATQGPAARHEAVKRYERLGGEVEARLVEKRIMLTAAERASRPVYDDLDVPRDQVTYSLRPRVDMAMLHTLGRPSRFALRLAARRMDGIARRLQLDYAQENIIWWRDGAGRNRLTDDLRQLETLTSILPNEVRYQLGGFARLATMARPETRRRYLMERVTETRRLLETYFRTALTEDAEALLEAAGTKISDSRKESGDLGGQGHAFFELVNTAFSASAADVETRLVELQAVIENPTTTDEALSNALDEFEIWNVVGNFASLSSLDMERGIAWMDEILTTFRSRRRAIEENLREEREAARAELRESLGRTTRDENAETERETFGQKAATAVAERMDIVQALRQSFPGSPWAEEMGQRLVRAVNQRTDAMHEHRQNFKAFVRELFGIRDFPGVVDDVFVDNAIARRLRPLFTRRQDTGVFLYEDRGPRRVDVPLEHAARAHRGEQLPGYTARQSADIGQAYEEYLQEGNELEDAVDNHEPGAGQRWAGYNRRTHLRGVMIRPGVVEQHMNEMEAAYYTLLLDQPQYQERAEMLGFPPEAREQLENFLSPEMRALRDYMRNTLRPMYDRINHVFEHVNGVNLPQLDTYFPGIFENTGQDRGVVDPFAPENRIHGMMDGFTKRRVPHSARRKRVSAFHAFFAHLEAAEHYIAFHEAARDMRAVIANPDVQAAITAQYGAKRTSFFRQWIELIEAGGTAKQNTYTTDYEIGNALLNNLTATALAFKASTLLVQTSNIFASLQRVGGLQWMKAAVRLGTNPVRLARRVMQMWRESEVIQRRLANGFSPELAAVLNGDPRRVKLWHVIPNLGFDLINRIDAGALAFGTAIAYEVELSRAMREAPTRAQAEALAMERTERIAQEVQQPVDFINKSLGESQANPWVKMALYMFISDPRRKVANLAVDVQNAMSGQAGSRGRLAQTTFVLFVLFPVWEWMMRGVAAHIFRGKDPEDAWDENELRAQILTGPLNGFTFYGPIYEAVVRTSLSWAAGDGAPARLGRNPLEDLARLPADIVKDGGDTMDAIKDGDWLEATGEVSKLMSASGMAYAPLGPVGNALTHGVGVAQNVEEGVYGMDVEGSGRAIMGAFGDLIPRPIDQDLAVVKRYEAAEEKADKAAAKAREESGEAEKAATIEEKKTELDKKLLELKVFGQDENGKMDRAEQGARVAALIELLNRAGDDERPAKIRHWVEVGVITRDVRRALEKPPYNFDVPEVETEENLD